MALSPTPLKLPTPACTPNQKTRPRPRGQGKVPPRIRHTQFTHPQPDKTSDPLKAPTPQTPSPPNSPLPQGPRYSPSSHQANIRHLATLKSDLGTGRSAARPHSPTFKQNQGMHPCRGSEAVGVGAGALNEQREMRGLTMASLGSLLKGCR